MNAMIESLINEANALGYCQVTNIGITGLLEADGEIYGTVTISPSGEISLKITFKHTVGNPDNPFSFDRFFDVNISKDRLLFSDGWDGAKVSWSSYGEVSGEVAGKMARCMTLAQEAATYLDKIKGE